MPEILLNKQQSKQGLVEFVKRNQYAILTALGVFSAAGLYYLSTINNKNKIIHNKQSLQYTTTISNKKIPSTNTTQLQQQIYNHQHNNQQTLTPTPQQQSKKIKHTLDRLKSRRQKLLSTSKQFKLQYIEQEILTSLLSEQCLLDIFDVCKELVDEEELNVIYCRNRIARREIFHHILLNADVINVRRESVESWRSQQDDFFTHRDYCNHQQLNSNNADSLQLHITSPKNITTIKNNLLRHKKLPISYPQALSFSQVYYRLVCTFEQDFKYLIEKTQKDFATFLNIDFSLITQSIDFHISKQHNQYFKYKIEQWTSLIKQSLKNKLVKYSQPIQVDRVCQILKREIEYLTERRELILEMIKKLGISDEEEMEAIPTFIECVLEDDVYGRFGVEMEQMTVEMAQLEKSKQLQILTQQFQKLTQSIVHEMHQQVNTEAIYNNDLQDSVERE